MFIAMLIRFVTMSLVYKIINNGDKFYHGKSMRAADEKPIINELGPEVNLVQLRPLILLLIPNPLCFFFCSVFSILSATVGVQHVGIQGCHYESPRW